MKRTVTLLVAAVAVATVAWATPATAGSDEVTLPTPFGSISIDEVAGPARGKCVDIPVTIDVDKARLAAAALPLRVSITDESNQPVAVVVWNPNRPIVAREYGLTMKACGKPHKYAVPSMNRGYNVITWDPRGEFRAGDVLQLDSAEFEDFDIPSILRDYEFLRR